MVGAVLFGGGAATLPVIGRSGSNAKAVEVALNALKPLHAVPRVGKVGVIEELMLSIGTKGYNIANAIPVVQLPSDLLVTFGGHHRVAPHD